MSASKFKFMQRLLADTSLSSCSKTAAVALLLVFHNNKTGRCNPSLGAIAAAIGLSRRAVIPAVAELKQSGWVDVESTGGGSQRNTNQYRFDFSRTAGVSSTSPGTSEENCTGEDDFTGGVRETSEGVKQTAHEPLRTTHAEGVGGMGDAPRRRAPDGAPPEVEAAFAEFWRQYPKRQGEDAARRAFGGAIAAGADPKAILAGVLRYAAERTGKPARYTAMPANWLRDGRWNDEPAAEGPAASKPANGGAGYRRSKPSLAEEMLRQGGHDIGGRCE